MTEGGKISTGPMIWDRTTPCESCPYRRDAKRGLWAAVEFTNLLAHDRDPLGAAFGCHEFNKRPPNEHRPCGGWLLDQKKRGVPNIRLRMILSTNAEARECYNRVDPAGLQLFSSIEEMVVENMRRMRNPMKPKEYKILRVEGATPGPGGPRRTTKPTGLIVTACTKKEAIKVARERLGRGSYEAR